jgi:iron-sulfur cluster assembly accessory protein
MVHAHVAEEARLMPITVTERAAREVAAILAGEAAPGAGNAGGAGATPAGLLRIWVAGSGCSGLRYGMGIDDKQPQPDDSVFESNGVRVVVDPRSLTLMDGSIVTWIDAADNSGFSIENPNAPPSAGCGCGESGCGSGCGEPGDGSTGAPDGEARGGRAGGGCCG